MDTEILIYVGGVFNLIWAVFDFFWPKLFNWKETLAPLDDFQRILLPLTTRMLVVNYLGVAYISFFHASDLIATDLGRTFLVFVSVFWAVRAVLQIHHMGFKRANAFNVELSSLAAFPNLSNRTISCLGFSEFLIIFSLYFIPVVYSGN